MKKTRALSLIISIVAFVAFAIWTVLVSFTDVQAIGPLSSSVGFATLNGYFHNLIGVNFTLYSITDLLSIIPIGMALGFAILGIIQWIKRKKLSKVDFSLFVLGGFYVAVLATYGAFEVFEINTRPVLIEGVLEASYPSSTTMLALCIIPTAAMQLHGRIKNNAIRIAVIAILIAFTAFMVIGRIISGVHWITDIIGGALISTGWVSLYYAITAKP